MNILEEAKKIIKTEAVAVEDLSEQLDQSFVDVVKAIHESQGKVVVTGVGKSGHVGEKMAATLSSTGTPSFFLHSTEGLHGDLGMVEKKDIVILISNSGETKEVLSLLPSLNTIGSIKIAITSRSDSTLVKNCDYNLG